MCLSKLDTFGSHQKGSSIILAGYMTSPSAQIGRVHLFWFLGTSWHLKHSPQIFNRAKVGSLGTATSCTSTTGTAKQPKGNLRPLLCLTAYTVSALGFESRSFTPLTYLLPLWPNSSIFVLSGIKTFLQKAFVVSERPCLSPYHSSSPPVTLNWINEWVSWIISGSVHTP